MQHRWQTTNHLLSDATFAPEWLPEKWRYVALGYLAAVVLHALGILIDNALHMSFSSFLFECVFTVLAVAVLAVTYGAGPSLVATLIGATVVFYILRVAQPARPSYVAVSAVWALVLLITGAFIAVLISHIQRLRLRAERVARQLQATLTAMPDAVLVFDHAGNLQQTNVAGHRMLGLSISDTNHSRLLDEHLLALAARDEQGRPLSREQLPTARVVRGEVLTGTSTMDLYLNTPDGHEIDLEVTGEPIVDTEAQSMGGVCVFRDVTERHRLQRRTGAALGALLAMAETLVEVPPDTAAESLSPPAAADASVLAAPTESATVKRLADLMLNALGCQRIGMFAIDAANGSLRPLAAAGARSAEEYQRWSTPPGASRLQQPPYPEVAARLQQGEVAIVDLARPPAPANFDEGDARLVLAAPMRVGGQLVGVLYLDYGGADHLYTPEEKTFAGAVAQLGALVIERDRLVREREAAVASELAMRETNRRMDEFLNIASHELKTPLTSLTGNIQLIERRLAQSPPEEASAADLARTHGIVRSSIERCIVALHRIGRLVDDLLGSARIHGGRLDIVPQPCELTAIVQRAIDEQRLLYPKRTIGLEPAAPPPILLVADADRIEQVMTNYLANAIKYSPESQPVEVCVGIEGGDACVTVRDHGIGVPVAEQERIWERFHRVAGAPVQTGSGIGLGIGLYICRSIIEAHHGRVGVDSVPGNGSTFWFTLPLNGALPAATPLEGTAAQPAEASPPNALRDSRDPSGPSERPG